MIAFTIYFCFLHSFRHSISLISEIDKLAETIHKAFRIATTGRPGPVLVDIPKDIQFKKGIYKGFEKKTWF